MYFDISKQTFLFMKPSFSLFELESLNKIKIFSL